MALTQSFIFERQLHRKATAQNAGRAPSSSSPPGIRSYSAVPVVFLTADEQNAEVERAVRDVPAVDSLGKPFSPDELLAKIMQALASNNPSAATEQ